MAAKWQQWMPLNINKIRGSMFFKALPDGAKVGYLFLLMAQWETDDGALPADPDELAILSGLGERWAEFGPRIMRKFDAIEGSRVRNSVNYQEWMDAKKVFEARKAGAHRTNRVRSASPEDTVTATVSATVSDEIASRPPDTTVVSVNVLVPDSADARILCEKVGIFDIRQQEAVWRLMKAHAESSGRNPPECIEHMRSRWIEYQGISSELEWQYGSAHKFFMSGKWDNPESWPMKEKPNGPDKSITRQRVDGNVRALGEALAKRGVAMLGGSGGANGAALPEPGSRSEPGGIPVRLRAPGPEVLAPESSRRNGGTKDQAGPEVLPPPRRGS